MADPVIISLTAIPSRFRDLGPVLQSLLAQDAPADEIRLNIPRRYRRFGDWDGALPDVPPGVRIARVAEDFGPATKVLPTVADLRGQQADILFCDDDKIYDRAWLSRFRQQRAQRPDAAIVEAGESLPDIGDDARAPDRLPRAKRLRKGWPYRLLRIGSAGLVKPHRYTASGYVDMLSGFGGVMIRPGFLDDPEVFDIPPVLWTVDDPWLSGHLERRGVPIWLNHRGRAAAHGAGADRDALLDLTEQDHGRDRANLAAIAYMRDRYGIWQPAGVPLAPQSWMHPTMRALAAQAAASGVSER